MVRVVVVGGGVSGVGTALALLKRQPQCHLTILAQDFSPATTGDGAAGLWEPYLTGETPYDKVGQWSLGTWKLFSEWWRSGLARKMGVNLLQGAIVGEEDCRIEPWHHLAFYCKDLTQEQCMQINPKYRSGFKLASMTGEVSKFLPVLLEEVKSLGGRLEVRRVSSLQEAAAEADLVINCAGLGSRDLVPDPTVYPCRGQVIRVRAPWIGEFLCDIATELSTYIIANTDTVVLGGTHQNHDWRLDVDPNDSQTIWDNCTTLMPSLKRAEVVQEWVGLRPCRKEGVRLEADEILLDSRTVPVVHNYGHGGCGVTLFWGCGQEAAAIASDLIYKYHGPPSRL
ncbi:D-aspartate oxidase [Panulirus ornatus]|uniref:D-aspartate oxidase n=1 Tax=Panulirus ornatus TaxID=150431 RepID=UPI003A8B944E